MNYIEPHNNPEILKLGIKFALYREKKPINVSVYKASVNWRKSRIAYLKEHEFKVGNIVYATGLKYEIKVIANNQLISISIDDKGKYPYKYHFIESDLSHYYSGQQAESFKYVREKILHGGEDMEGAKFNTGEWQEVEEPEPMFVGKTKYHEPTYEPNPKYTQFQEDVNKGIILAEINRLNP